MKEELKDKMRNIALEHVYKVNADPDIQMEDVDAFDAWISFNNDWDINVHEDNFGMTVGGDSQNDASKFVWNACAYKVFFDEDEEVFHTAFTEPHPLFKYEKKGRVTFITDQ